jgi:hypothetical protein
VNSNGHAPKQKAKLEALKASLDALIAIAEEGRGDEDEVDHERIISYLHGNELPVDEDTAHFFLPDVDEFAHAMAALMRGPVEFATTIAAFKASSFMHGYVHAQMKDGVRDEDGKVRESQS